MGLINLSRDDKQRLADQYDENKLTFERVLSRDLRAFFAALGSDIFASFAAKGLPPDFNTYLEELAAILRKNYRRVGSFFSSHIDRLIKELEPEDRQVEEIEQIRDERLAIEALLLLSLNEYYARQSRQQATFILNTTTKITRDVRIRVLAESTLEGENLTEVQISQRIAREVTRRNMNRVPNISEDQVGTIAQVAKQSELDQLLKQLRLSGLGLEPIKTWVNAGDERVREAHQIANFQERPFNEPFLVAGELLMYPKDTSLGASLSNTIGCRCDSVTEI